MKCFPLHISEEHCVMLSDELFSFATDSAMCYAFEHIARHVNVSSHTSLEHLIGFINTIHAQKRKAEEKLYQQKRPEWF